jgi:predicted SAM-dependent methyltransferase
MGELQLHLGCGNIRIPGFIGIDSRQLPSVDVITSADKLDMFEQNSVDLIYACHVLEHFPRRDTLRVLKEWYRILRPSGTLRIAVPDFEACIKVYQITKNMSLLLGHLVGGQEYSGNIHYMVFDEIYLSTLLSEAGFRCIRRYDWNKTTHRDYDDRSQGYYPHMDKGGILMSLNMEANK